MSMAPGIGIGIGSGRYGRAVIERAYDVGILLAGVVHLVGKTPDGDRIRLIEPAWQAILAVLDTDPEAAFRIKPRRWEELVAAAYEAEGYAVELTPRSGDGGVDVIATLDNGPRVRIFDQVKAYGRGNLVPANDVRALMGVVAQGGRGVIFFCVQRADVQVVRPADEIDPLYGETLRQALAAGVEALACRALVCPDAVILDTPIPVICP